MVSDSSIVAVLLVIMVLCYFLPTLIAYSRRHRKRAAILVLNLLTGWTAVGWVISAVWSSTPNVQDVKTIACIKSQNIYHSRFWMPK